MINLKPERITQKIMLLREIKAKLKEEFFGINDVIDKLVDSIEGWYIIPDIQTKPLVINLWGMTGIGKTSLVRRLVELLNLTNSLFLFDIGERSNYSRSDIRARLEEIYEMKPDHRLILAFDEFQYAKTIDESYHEINNPESRIIWEILGSSCFTFSKVLCGITELINYTRFLQSQYLKGITVESGIVVSRDEQFVNSHQRNGFVHNSIAEGTSFYSSGYIDELFELVRDQFSSMLEVTEYLLTLDGSETISFLNKVLKDFSFDITVDCSKALIFIIGNLDEAYGISNNLNPDMSADRFHSETQKVNLTMVKEVLKYRFRNEQVARLGNNHIIYPSLNSAAFTNIINKELQQIARNLREEYDIDVTFDKSVLDLIYKEGVFPSQGVRPVYTTIDNIILSNVPKIIYKMIKKGLASNNVIVSVKESNLVVNYREKNITRHIENIKLSLNVEKLRECKKDEKQAIIAVHESGHSIVSTRLLGQLPDKIVSVSADSKLGGITLFADEEKEYVSRDELVKFVAIDLAGYVAERIVFGEEKVSDGSGGDFKRATSYASMMIKRSGFGDQLGCYSIKSPNNEYRLFEEDNEINQSVKNILIEGEIIAEGVLEENKLLLIHLADYLSDNSQMDQSQFLSFVKDYSDINLETINENSYYRTRIKELVRSSSQLRLEFTGTDN